MYACTVASIDTTAKYLEPRKRNLLDFSEMYNTSKQVRFSEACLHPNIGGPYEDNNLMLFTLKLEVNNATLHGRNMILDIIQDLCWINYY